MLCNRQKVGLTSRTLLGDGAAMHGCDRAGTVVVVKAREDPARQHVAPMAIFYLARVASCSRSLFSWSMGSHYARINTVEL